MQRDEDTEGRLSELEKRTIELEEHKVRVDERMDHLLKLMLQMSARISRV